MKKISLLACLFLFVSTILFSGEDNRSSSSQLIENTRITGYWSLGVSYDVLNASHPYGPSGEALQLITPEIRKSYFSLETRLNEMFTARVSQEIYGDFSGDDKGISMRLKHLYLEMQPFEDGLFEHFWVRAGIIPRPWLDFEHSINRYRYHMLMASELLGLTNAADRGVSISGMIGEPRPAEKKNEPNERLAGKYGSYSFGVYSGGGYLAPEKNDNKTVEGRISLRPLWNSLPGMQLSYAFARGKGNMSQSSIDNPAVNSKDIGNYRMNIFYLSYSDRLFNTSVQYMRGIGDYRGHFYKNNYQLPGETESISLFLESIIQEFPVSMYVRYDYFLRGYDMSPLFNFEGYHLYSPGMPPNEFITTGISYRFMDNMITLGYKYAPSSAMPGKEQTLSLMMLVNY